MEECAFGVDSVGSCSLLQRLLSCCVVPDSRLGQAPDCCDKDIGVASSSCVGSVTSACGAADFRFDVSFFLADLNIKIFLAEILDINKL